MKSKHFILGSALTTTLIFTGCQPRQTISTESSPLLIADESVETDGMLVATASPSTADGGVMVGGAMMVPSRPIPVNASEAQNLTTLVAAIKQAGLAETLSGPGPYTVFAPTNAAFEKLPPTTLQSFMTPEKKAELSGLLTYHVVPGTLDASMLTSGRKLTTVQGEQLTVVVEDGKVMIKDAKGNVANVETADVYQSNGVVHVIDTVLMPNQK